MYSSHCIVAFTIKETSMHQTLHFKKTQQKQKRTLKHKSIAGYLIPQHKCELVPDPEDVKNKEHGCCV